MTRDRVMTASAAVAYVLFIASVALQLVAYAADSGTLMDVAYLTLVPVLALAILSLALYIIRETEN